MNNFLSKLKNFFFKKKESTEKEAPPLTDDQAAMVAAITRATDPLLKQSKSQNSFARYKFWLMFAFMFGIFIMQAGSEYIQRHTKLENNYVSLVKINGPIGPGKMASPEVVNPLLVAAFKDTHSKGVIINVNSPGGTPVAASAIRQRIIELRDEYPDKRVIVVGGDYLTSGAYMIATGADEIYTDESSIVGSIGVIVRAFGATQLAEKLGVERRVIHAGANKAGMDTFLPFDESDKHKMEEQLNIVHQQFIAKVKQSRGEKLALNNDDLFTGAYWTGNVAQELGLIDGIGHLATISNDIYGTSNFKVYKGKKSFLSSLREPSQASISSFLDSTGLTMLNQPLLMPF